MPKNCNFSILGPKKTKLFLKPKIIFVLGGPGSGKGTQCERLCEEFHIKHLSAGALLREEQTKPTAEGRVIDLYLKEGRIVPVGISLTLLKKAIVESEWSRYLIDGFPRNFDNLDGWNAEMKDDVDLESVLFIDCSENVMEQRILKRGENSGRDDDNLVSAKKRFQTFQKETMPVVQRLQEENPTKFTSVNGDGSIDECYREFRQPLLRNLETELVDKVGDYIDAKYKAGSMKEGIHSSALDPTVTFSGQYAEVTYKILEEKLNDQGRPTSQTILPGKRKSMAFIFKDGTWIPF